MFQHPDTRHAELQFELSAVEFKADYQAGTELDIVAVNARAEPDEIVFTDDANASPNQVVFADDRNGDDTIQPKHSS